MFSIFGVLVTQCYVSLEFCFLNVQYLWSIVYSMFSISRVLRILRKKLLLDQFYSKILISHNGHFAVYFAILDLQNKIVFKTSIFYQFSLRPLLMQVVYLCWTLSYMYLRIHSLDQNLVCGETKKACRHQINNEKPYLKYHERIVCFGVWCSVLYSAT